ncbi:solute carrier family 22 member 15-like isoform X2 [Oscarella lobularis]|uniref:solute carrier family 22 member 15-like isoform X2 n=1 Tax=Oscarella lobularis TaxID=121494 RepID=UPI0033133427
MSLDDALSQVGEFGRYQKLVIIAIFVSCTITGNVTLLGFFAETEPTSWTCVGAAPPPQSPALSPDDVACRQWENGTCEIGYTLKRDTVVNEWNIICSDKWKMGLSTSAYFVGVGVGSFLFGWISDRWGRRFTVLTSFILTDLSIFLTVLAPSYSFYVFLRLFAGFSSSSLLSTSFVIVGEIVGPSSRESAQNFVQSSFTFGMIILGLVAMSVKNWRRLSAVTAVPGVAFFFILWRFLPESPRWLLLQNRKVEYEALLKKMAAVNGSSISRENLIVSPLSRKEGKTVAKRSGLIDILVHREARRRLCITAYLWFVSSLVYYGLSMNANLGSSLYVSYLASALAELPSLVVSSYLLKKQGRKKSNISFAVLTAVFLCLAAFFSRKNSNSGQLLLTVSILGKFSVSALFANAYIYTGELAPTEVRSFILGINSIAARLGGIILPYVLMLRDFYEPLPFIVFAGTTLFLAATLPFLPETRNTSLPETLSDLN